jgi:hypothetical protein
MSGDPWGRVKRFAIVVTMLTAACLAGCADDDCDHDSDCKGDQVCAKCSTAVGSCHKCVDSGSVELCTCL